MMKRITLIIAVLMILSVAPARAQQPTFAMIAVNGCSGATPYGNAQWCFDGDTVTNPGVWYNNGGTFVLVSGGGGGGLTPTFTSVTATGTVVGNLGIGSKPAALAAFGTCNAAHEGLFATQTNSTAACSAGATATSAGTTHCAIYCNGTNWLQLGI